MAHCDLEVCLQSTQNTECAILQLLATIISLCIATRLSIFGKGQYIYGAPFVSKLTYAQWITTNKNRLDFYLFA